MVIALLILAAVCLLLAIVGKSATRKIQKDTGVFAIGGPNGGGASKLLSTHPPIRAIYDKMESGGKSEQNIQQLLQMGAKAVITPQIGDGMLVLTEEAAIAFGETGGTAFGTKGQIFYPMTRCCSFLQREEIKVKVEVGTETTQTKGKSVIGGAVVGSVLAGGVGAVVGAIATANHNTNNREITTIKYETRGTGVDIAYLKFKDGNGKLFLDNIYVADDVNVKVSSVYQAVNDIIGIIDKKDYRKAATNTAEDDQDDMSTEEFLEWVSKDTIMNYLEKHPKSTVTMIRDGCPELEMDNLGISGLLRQLIGEGEVVRSEEITEEGHFAVFSLK